MNETLIAVLSDITTLALDPSESLAEDILGVLIDAEGRELDSDVCAGLAALVQAVITHEGEHDAPLPIAPVAPSRVSPAAAFGCD